MPDPRREPHATPNPVNGAESVRAPDEPRRCRGISGNPRLRQTLSCTRGDWDDEAADRYAVTYRWLRDGVEIAGATPSTYTTVRADVQHEHRLPRPRRGPDRRHVSAASTSAGPDNLVAPNVAGDPRLFRTLTCSRGDWDDIAADRYAVTYSWFRNSVQIPGAAARPTRSPTTTWTSRSYCRVRAEDLIDANSAERLPGPPRARSCRRRCPASRTCAAS